MTEPLPYVSSHFSYLARHQFFYLLWIRSMFKRLINKFIERRELQQLWNTTILCHGVHTVMLFNISHRFIASLWITSVYSCKYCKHQNHCIWLNSDKSHLYIFNLLYSSIYSRTMYLTIHCNVIIKKGGVIFCMCAQTPSLLNWCSWTLKSPVDQWQQDLMGKLLFNVLTPTYHDLQTIDLIGTSVPRDPWLTSEFTLWIAESPN